MILEGHQRLLKVWMPVGGGCLITDIHKGRHVANTTLKKETRDAKGIKRKGRSYLGQERLPGGGEVEVGLEGQI